MLEMPRRNVTRFFIPLIDVLTLLFCVFLIMPLAKNAPEESPELASRTPEEQVDYLKQEVKRLREDALRWQKELAELRQQKLKNLSDRLLVRVLEIDPSNGVLFERDPDRIEIRDEKSARALIRNDQDKRGLSDNELYYLILYPRSRESPYPTRNQRKSYENWFRGVPMGFDVPGATVKGEPSS